MIKSKSIWISFDLGVQGDYEGLYRWLDNKKASECGDSLAHCKIDVPDEQDLPSFVAQELKSNVKFANNDRIYLIWRHDDGRSVRGRFIVGKRKGSPWKGYGDQEQTQDDE